MNKKIWVLCIVLLCGLVSCSRGVLSDYGAAMNERRGRVGLPPVEGGWFAHRVFLSKQGYWLTGLEDGQAGLFSKKVAWNEAGLVWEQDTFRSGRRLVVHYQDPDYPEPVPGVEEEMSIQYAYQDGVEGGREKGGRAFYVMTTNDFLRIDAPHAMCILKEWGIAHPLQMRLERPEVK